MSENPAVRATATNQPADPADDIFLSLRQSGLPLNAQLERLSQAIARSDPAYARAYDQLVERLKRAHVGEGAPQRGEPMPDFLLPDDSGHLVSLAALRQHGPVIVAFLRGHWCPYCRLNASALAGLEADIKPAQIVGISAEAGQFAKSLRADSGAQFPFLTDLGNGYALMLGLAFALGDELAAMLLADACDIPAYQNAAGWVLPVPAVFVVGRDGIIQERYVNPDFRQRMEIDALRQAAIAASIGDG